MPAANKVRKRCTRCGWQGEVRVRARTCWRPRFGKGSWACGGKLQRVVRREFDPFAVERPKGVGIGWHLSEEADQAMSEQYRARAAKDLAHARGQLEKAITSVRRATTSVKLWQGRVASAEKRAAMTDAEIVAARDKRRSRPAKVLRGMKL